MSDAYLLSQRSGLDPDPATVVKNIGSSDWCLGECGIYTFCNHKNLNGCFVHLINNDL